MNNTELIELYFNELKRSSLDRAKAFHAKIRSSDRDSTPEGFNTLYTALRLYLNISNEQIEKSITDGDKDYSMDAIYIPTTWSTCRNICIFDVKSNGSLKFTEIKLFLEYIETYVLEGNDLPRKWNPQLLSRLKELHDYLDQNPLSKIDIIVYREWQNNPWVLREEEKRLQGLKLKYDRLNQIRILWKSDIFDLVTKRLWYEWNIYSNNYANFSINLDRKNLLININKETLIWVFSLFDILSFIRNIEVYNNELHSNNKRYDIFRLNVRKKSTSERSKLIRWKIVETVIKSPNSFLNYHNWITITCEELKVSDTSLWFIQPQIVNWCQTISWLYEAFSDSISEYYKIILGESTTLRSKDDIIKVIQDIDKLKNALIQIKILVVNSVSDEPKKITNYANSQAEVSNKDLVSNDIEQLIISSYLGINWFNYIRKDGQEIDKDKRTIDMDTIYKFMYSYIYLDPSRWKEHLNRLLFKDERIYWRLFPSLFQLEDILKIAEIYKKIADYRKKNKGISKYYDDFMAFWLYIIIKEWWISRNVKPNTIKEIIDSFIKSKTHKDYILIFQRRPQELVRYLIQKLESKYKFKINQNKFDELKKEFISVRRELIRKEKIGNSIYIDWLKLEKLNWYLNERNQSNSRHKNLILIILDIISDNNWLVTINQLNEILRKIKPQITDKYIYTTLLKHNDKININPDNSMLTIPIDV